VETAWGRRERATWTRPVEDPARRDGEDFVLGWPGEFHGRDPPGGERVGAVVAGLSACYLRIQSSQLARRAVTSLVPSTQVLLGPPVPALALGVIVAASSRWT